MYVCTYVATEGHEFLLAFYLVAGRYQQVTKGVETQQRALDIFWTFFIENAVSIKCLFYAASLQIAVVCMFSL